MMLHRVISRSLAIGVVAFAGTLAVVATPGLALPSGVPMMRVTPQAVPTNFPPGGTAEYVLRVANVGSAPTTGAITVVDKLPLGMTATASGGRGFESEPLGSSYWECSGTTVVICNNNPSGPAVVGAEGEVFQPIVIDVAVPASPSAGATNEVSVLGGGAAEVVRREPTMISVKPAGFGLESFEQVALNHNGSPDTQAGAHPYSIVTNFTVNNVGHHLEEVPVADEPKDLDISLPTGFVGNPSAAPKCPRALFDLGRKELQEPECPANTKVGTITLAFASPYLVLRFPVYNLESPPDAPAQFGFAYQYRVGFIDAGVRTGEGYGVKVVLHNVDQLRVLRASMTLWGMPSEHGSGGGSIPLLTNPTSCGVPLANAVSMDSWEEPIEELHPFSFPVSAEYPQLDEKGDPIEISGCDRLDFSPSLEVRPEASAANTPTGLNVDVKVPQTERPEGLAEAHLKDATIALPAGMAVSPSVANGLEACTSAEIGIDNGNPAACPDGAKIGTVEVDTPLLEHPLTGSVYVAAQGDNPFGSLLAIYVTAEGAGVVVKLAGHVQADPKTGQLTTTFDENPQLPFSELKVHLYSGPRAPLVMAACGSYTPSAQLTGWNGAVVVPPIESFSVATGCTHGFSPSFTAGTTNNEAGGFAPFSLTISRPDGDQTLGALSVTTPPGLLGMLSRVPRCDEQDASQGTCPEASLIGHTTATAGPGPYPVTVSGGRVYLTGPYKGAPFGLSIVVPAVAGPFNLGNVKVRAAIYVDPHTSRITVVSDSLPTIEQGILLQIRTVNVSIDRAGFMFNPTNCSPLSVDGAIAGSEGAKAVVSSRFQAADCASLPFKPKFTVSTWGGTSKKLGASLDVKVASSSGQANIGKVFVSLPKQLPSRLTTLQQACPGATFAANPATCPAASVVGTAKAVTPVLNEPVSGPAYLVSHGGAAFPDLVVILQGQGVRLDLIGNTNIKKGITTSSFAAVPDAPVTSFELKLPQGAHSALTATLPASARGSLCSTKLLMPTTLTGQNGAQVTQSTRISIQGCPKKAKSAARGAKNAKRKR